MIRNGSITCATHSGIASASINPWSAISSQSGNQVEVWIGSEHRGLNTSRQRCDDQIGERNIVAFGCQFTTKGRSLTPIVPGWFEIMCQAEARRHPVCLLRATKTAKDFSENWPVNATRSSSRRISTECFSGEPGFVKNADQIPVSIRTKSRSFTCRNRTRGVRALPWPRQRPDNRPCRRRLSVPGVG